MAPGADGDRPDLDRAAIPENDRFVNDARVGGDSQRRGTLFECRDPECSEYIYSEEGIDEKSAQCSRHGQMKMVEPEK